MQGILRCKTLYFIQYDVFGRPYPFAEQSIGFIGLCEAQQVAQVEIPVDDAGAVLLGIEGIASLLDVGRYHQDGFSKVHGFAHGFKSGRAGIGLASRHLP